MDLEIVKYFDSGILIPEGEIKADDLKTYSFYNKMYIEDNREIKSEFYSNGKIVKVVYFNQDINKTEIINNHLKEYGSIEFEVCNRFNDDQLFCQYRFYFNTEGALQNYCC